MSGGASDGTGADGDRHEAIRLFVTLYEAWGKPLKANEWRVKLEAQTPR